MKAATRNKLPSSAFAEPAQRKFPINNPAHARAAIMLSKFASNPAQVKAKAERVLKTGNATSSPFPRVGGAGPTLGSLAQRRGRRGG